ncbi:MAG: M50 family metallopeptidase [Georgenia sp.]
MDYVIGVLVLVIGLIASIALHEIGHLVPAKKFGVKVPQYMVGFGKTLWSKTVGGTEYGLKAVPLGGYVRLVGMYPPARRAARTRRDGRPTMVEEARQYSLEEIGPGEEHRAFYNLTVPRKLVVMFGGPFMNLVIAAVLMAVVVSGLGIAQYTATLGAVQECVTPDGACAPDAAAAPAAAAGLEPGDTVLRWGTADVTTWADLSAAIAAGGTGPTAVVVDRAGERLTLQVTPQLTERPVVGGDGGPVLDQAGRPVTEMRPFVGVGPTVALTRRPLTAVPGMVWSTFTGTVTVVLTLPQRLVDVANAAFGTQQRDPGVMGLIGVGRVAGEIASVQGDGYGVAERTADLLSLLVSLNMALLVFNLIPLLPLDGGHMAGALVEGARRGVARLRERPDPGPVDVARMLPLTYAVVAVMLGMSALLAYADIVDPLSLTG